MPCRSTVDTVHTALVTALLRRCAREVRRLLCCGYAALTARAATAVVSLSAVTCCRLSNIIRKDPAFQHQTEQQQPCVLPSTSCTTFAAEMVLLHGVYGVHVYCHHVKTLNRGRRASEVPFGGYLLLGSSWPPLYHQT